LSTNKEKIEETLSFFEENTICPSCSQGIPHEHKDSIIKDIQSQCSSIDEKIITLEEANNRLQERQAKLDELNSEILSLNILVNSTNATNMTLNEQNKKLEKQIKEAKSDTSNIDAERKKLSEIVEEAMKLLEKKKELNEQRIIEDVSYNLLKDTGIKTAIIREYLPVMNKLINSYLNAMDFYVHFELDESFNEIIKSRHRDEFSYASFSEGEKMRIDLAILFTWRHIAKMKNSINTNLLILDEIFDSSLDNSGTDYFLSIMNAFGEKSNVFVISHKGDQLFDKFHSVIKFEKKGNFSVIA
jgi:DNA repair exonuclease SbcCD ATPase subunit